MPQPTAPIFTATLADYEYHLPPELIAQFPPEKREDARMLVLHRAEERLEHRRFSDLPSYLQPGDLAVLNDTRVLAARVILEESGIELLFLEQLGPTTWKCLVKPGRKLRVGKTFDLRGNPGEIREIVPPNGERIIEFRDPVDLEKIGTLPLPPYMERQAAAGDAERYQTVYARQPGAVAAPTAGLHFTPEILAQVPHAFLTLHVGVGTFRPVQVEKIADHHMHAERYYLPETTVRAINGAQRVLAIGTTTTRVLESCARETLPLVPREGSTDIFIYPPYEFRVVDALLTNFHLPKSTLLMLVSAFAGRDFILRAYAEAVRARYRFFSYGDCMLIL